MVIDIGFNNIQNTVIHELTHSVDYTLQRLGYFEDMEEAWSDCNPEGFEYLGYDGYLSKFDNTYLGEDYNSNFDPDVIYFARDYSKSTSLEDRATAVEYFYYLEGHEMIYESSHMKDKISLYIDYLKTGFKSFENFDASGFGARYNEIIGQ